VRARRCWFAFRRTCEKAGKLTGHINVLKLQVAATSAMQARVWFVGGGSFRMGATWNIGTDTDRVTSAVPQHS
jgi:hypothetical protein